MKHIWPGIILCRALLFMAFFKFMVVYLQQ